jgi:hypothetical protein
MQLRNRDYHSQLLAKDDMSRTQRRSQRSNPANETKPFLDSFSLFPKLPIEIRQIIWRLTLRPRVIEILHGVHDSCFYSRANLPVALVVCQDSRNALISSYPVSFGSALKVPQIRFNFSLDTLYFDCLFSDHFFHFLDVLTSRNVSELRYIAICEASGFHPYADNQHEEFWKSLEQHLDALTGLKELLVVLEIGLAINANDEQEFMTDLDKPLEFFNEIPLELRRRRDLKILDVEKEFYLTEGWGQHRVMPKLVWGWRCAKYPQYA